MKTHADPPEGTKLCVAAQCMLGAGRLCPKTPRVSDGWCSRGVPDCAILRRPDPVRTRAGGPPHRHISARPGYEIRGNTSSAPASFPAARGPFRSPAPRLGKRDVRTRARVAPDAPDLSHPDTLRPRDTRPPRLRVDGTLIFSGCAPKKTTLISLVSIAWRFPGIWLKVADSWTVRPVGAMAVVAHPRELSEDGPGQLRTLHQTCGHRSAGTPARTLARRTAVRGVHQAHPRAGMSGSL